jgi:signal peptidase
MPTQRSDNEIVRRFRPGQLLGKTLAGLFLVTLAAITLGPRVLPYRTFFVRSGSMRPTLPVGSLAIYTPVAAADLKVGDVIAFERPVGVRGLVTHRIVGIEHSATGTDFVTKGDANGIADAWRIPSKGHGWRLACVVPYVGYLPGALGIPLVRLALASLIAFGVAARLLIRIWRPRPAIA